MCTAFPVTYPHTDPARQGLTYLEWHVIALPYAQLVSAYIYNDI